jgi:hypothetical protein
MTTTLDKVCALVDAVRSYATPTHEGKWSVVEYKLAALEGVDVRAAMAPVPDAGVRVLGREDAREKVTNFRRAVVAVAMNWVPEHLSENRALLETADVEMVALLSTAPAPVKTWTAEEAQAKVLALVEAAAEGVGGDTMEDGKHYRERAGALAKEMAAILTQTPKPEDAEMRELGALAVKRGLALEAARREKDATDAEVARLREKLESAWGHEADQRTRAMKEQDRAAAAEKRVAELEAFAKTVEGIMDSICGTQAFNWSAHAYPLRAALEKAGFPGKGYEEARAGVGTLLERVNELEAELASWKRTAGQRLTDLADAEAQVAALTADKEVVTAERVEADRKWKMVSDTLRLVDARARKAEAERDALKTRAVRLEAEVNEWRDRTRDNGDAAVKALESADKRAWLASIKLNETKIETAEQAGWLPVGSEARTRAGTFYENAPDEDSNAGIPWVVREMEDDGNGCMHSDMVGAVVTRVGPEKADDNEHVRKMDRGLSGEFCGEKCPRCASKPPEEQAR